MEQRPYRYGFVEFIIHHHRKSDIGTINALIGDMSPEDKAVLAQLNFDACYVRIYGKVPSREEDRYRKYLDHKTHFEKTFLADGGKWLTEQLSRGGCNGLLWDIPRGRAESHERDLNCAVREFHEETGIPAGDYSILDTVARTQKFQSFGCQYINHFYLAVLRNQSWNSPRNLRIDYSSNQHCEVRDLRWMGLQEISVSDTYGRLYGFLRGMVKVLKKYHKLSSS
jgi:8-oxo-dGTP pyrophosphatase MutT (NUDIX family)